MESDEEWAMNKKVVDLSSRDIRQAVSFFCFLLMSFILPPLSQCLTSLVFFSGSSRVTVLLCGFWTAGWICARYRERAEVPTLFRQSKSGSSLIVKLYKQAEQNGVMNGPLFFYFVVFSEVHLKCYFYIKKHHSLEVIGYFLSCF